MRKNELYEMSFLGPEPKESKVYVDFSVKFTVNDQCKIIKGFYAGNGVYKVRFLPQESGMCSWEVISGLALEGTLNGKDEILPAYENEHGFVRTCKTHFVYEDQTPYLPVGTTVYALAHQPDELVEQTLKALKNSPFNKVRMSVFPKSLVYTHNEPKYYPFEKHDYWDVNCPNYKFWDRLESIIQRINDMNIQVDLILFHPYDRWGFSCMFPEQDKTYLEYLIRRLAAFPQIWWSLSNEYDLIADKTLDDWYELEEYIAKEDPYHHLLSVHNCLALWDASRPNITHVSAQTKELSRVSLWMEKYKKPVVVDECGYEGNLSHDWGALSARELVHRFWRTYTCGGFCGHSETYLEEHPESNNKTEWIYSEGDPVPYHANDILWWNKGGTLKGDSVPRILFLKEIFEKIGPLSPMTNRFSKLRLLTTDQLEMLSQNATEVMKPYLNALKRMTPEDRANQFVQKWSFEGHRKNEVILKYYDIRCTCEDVLELPEDFKYCVKIIDTWNMTSLEYAKDVSGKICLHLPGKEGIAVLAIRT